MYLLERTAMITGGTGKFSAGDPHHLDETKDKSTKYVQMMSSTVSTRNSSIADLS